MNAPASDRSQSGLESRSAGRLVECRLRGAFSHAGRRAGLGQYRSVEPFPYSGRSFGPTSRKPPLDRRHRLLGLNGRFEAGAVSRSRMDAVGTLATKRRSGREKSPVATGG